MLFCCELACQYFTEFNGCVQVPLSIVRRDFPSHMLLLFHEFLKNSWSLSIAVEQTPTSHLLLCI